MMSAAEPGLGGGNSLDRDGAPMQGADATRESDPPALTRSGPRGRGGHR